MRWFVITLLFFIAAPAFAQISPDEQRARDIGAQLRCVVCQNQSIEESDAPLAGDMRRLVREQLATGASDAEVMSYIRESYGDYVLLKPPVQSNTYVLWILPAALLLLSLAWFAKRLRQKETPPDIETVALSEDDKQLLDKLMSNDT